MIVTQQHVVRASKRTPNASNLNSVFKSLDKYGVKLGLDKPHRTVHYLSQMMHESGEFRYDRELVNKDGSPTAQQQRYERDFNSPWTATDPRNKLAFQLGNSERGDGMRFAGRGGIQLTGRGNYRRFTEWARRIDPLAPNFELQPDLLNSDPWEGLAPLWYWSEGNPTGKSLNAYADQNNAEMITKRINGGLHGYADRLEYYDRLGLVVLGYGPTERRRFQTESKEYNGEIDDDAGPLMRAAIHARLVKLTAPAKRSDDVQAGPVVTEKPVAVPAPGLEKPWYQSPEIIGPAAAGPALTGLAAFDWRALAIIVPLILIFVVWLIIRRDRAKEKQNAAIAAITEKTV